MIDHFGTKALIDAVGGFGKEERFQAAQNPFQDRHYHQGNAQRACQDCVG